MGSIFWGNDHNGFPVSRPPHQNLGIVGIRLNQGVDWDGFISNLDLRLFLDQWLHHCGSFAQRPLGIHFNADLHPPADGPEQHHLGCGFVHGHQPCGEVLVPLDGTQESRAAGGAHRDTPCHTRAEVVVHADGQFGALFGGTHYGVHLGGAAVPGVVHAIRIADGLNLPTSQLWQLPAGSEEGR